MVKQYGQLLRETRARLRPMEGELAAQTARELLAMASGKSVAALLADQELYASEAIEARLGDLTARYLAGCPLAYLLGQWDFPRADADGDARCADPTRRYACGRRAGH